MIKLVIINGLGGVGKSTFISYCADYCLHTSTVVTELSTVDYVKQVARWCGWDGGKSNKDRVFLSDLKIALAKWNNIPINNVFDSIDWTVKTIAGKDFVFFINSREPADIDEIYKRANELNYPIMRILVTNKNSEVNEVAELIDGITIIEYDKIITNNDSLDDLRAKAKNFIDDLIS